MSKKKGNFVEQHVDKLILAGIGLVCLGLLWIYIFRNPFGPEIDGKKESPASGHARLEQKKVRLRERLDSSLSTISDPLPDFAANYQRVLGCSIPEINTAIYPLAPGIGNQPIESDREYAVPEIPALQEVQIAYIRGAAHLPMEEVTPEMPYQAVTAKKGDLDFVTVSARLDVKRLVQQFQSCFMGIGVKSAHKDPVLATPVAARIELQRSVLREDGSWSDWEAVLLPQTEAYRKLFEKLPRSADLLPGGGIHIQMAQYKDLLKQIAILQPRAYDFASSRYQYWMAPQYLDEVQKLLQQQRDENRRLKRESAAAGGRETEGMGGGPERPGMGRPSRTPMRPTRPETTRGRDPRGGGMETGEYGLMGPDAGSPVRPAVRQRTIEDVYRDYRKELILTDWWTRNEPLLIWAHDDTVQPGKTYKYQIRVGIFNPIAGRDWFRSDSQKYKDQVILWSPFAKVESKKNEPITAVIPKMLHIFPMDMAKNNPEAVVIKVSKYYMGRWNSEDFDVLPGQVIGSVVEQKKNDPLAGTTGIDPMSMEMGMLGMTGMPGASSLQTVQDSIDFTTDFLYVDAIGEVDWSGSVSALRRKEFTNMLYTTDGMTIKKLPIKQQNWSADLKKNYRDVLEAEREAENEVLVERSTQPSMMQMPGIPPRGVPPMGGYFGGEGFME